ncbi:MAG TPA: M28 family peptidase [Acidobacteriota bacterium]|nr:M28 family peptidase [Acidobacteriota bacterium]
MLLRLAFSLSLLPNVLLFSFLFGEVTTQQQSAIWPDSITVSDQAPRPSYGSSRRRDRARQPGLDRAKIMSHVQAIVAFGPHPPGSDAQKKVGDYLITQLKSYGLKVQTQEFQPLTPIGPLQMRNIWGVLPGTSGKAIILASHYDSKYFEDFRFVGANDGASSCAVVLELARVLSQDNPTNHEIWFVFFDGEESIREWTDFDSLYGSREFVKMLNSQQLLRSVGALILLDLVGEKDLMFRRDTNSTRWLVDIIWTTASRLGYGDKFPQAGTISAIDDHIPFAQQGVPVIDIIDLDYAYWHTPQDTLDKLSAENMRIVGEVVLKALPEIGRVLSK